MDFKIRFTDKNDYSTLSEWWNWFRFPVPTKDMLPNDMKDGLMVSLNGENIVAGFIYRTPSIIYWIEYIVSNPNIKNKKTRKAAKEFLINSLCQVSKNLGAKLMFTSLINQNLIKDFKSCGFQVGNINTTQLIKPL